MLYLRTGSNGACKSLFTLKDVREKQVAELRPVCFLVGKPAKGDEPADPSRVYVKVKPEKAAEFGWTTCHYSEWWQQQDGTIFVADEAHNYWPKRANGSAVPDYVEKLAEHRARGFDFFVLTQHGSNLDSFITKLIGAPGWHQHLKRVAGGSSVTSVLQFDAYHSTAEKAGSGKSAQVVMRSQPKEVYDWYQSAELHTAKVRIPKAMWFLVFAAVTVPLLVWGVGSRLMAIGDKGTAAAKKTGTDQVSSPVTPGNEHQARSKPRTAAEYVDAHRPRVAGMMHTAPVYDGLTEPKRVPVAAACIMSAAKGCKCFTQDATPYPVDVAMCKGMVEHGTFYAFSPEGQVHKPEAPAARSVVPPGGPVAPPAAIEIAEAPKFAPIASNRLGVAQR